MISGYFADAAGRDKEVGTYVICDKIRSVLGALARLTPDQVGLLANKAKLASSSPTAFSRVSHQKKKLNVKHHVHTPKTLSIERSSPSEVITQNLYLLEFFILSNPPHSPPFSARARSFIDNTYAFLGLYVTTLFSVCICCFSAIWRTTDILSLMPMPPRKLPRSM